MELELLLHNPLSPDTLGMVLRFAELTGIGSIYIRDGNGLLAPEYSDTLIASSEGAILHHPVQPVDDTVSFLRAVEGSKCRAAAVVHSCATPLFDYQFCVYTLLVVGDGHCSLPHNIIAACDELVTVPQYTGRQSHGGKEQLHSLQSAVTMFGYEFMRQRDATTNR